MKASMEPDRLGESRGTGQQATGSDCKSDIGTEMEACQKAPVSNTEGSPQGGGISPTYANMVLDGMEPMMLDVYWRSRVKRTFSVKYNNHKVHMVRFADDFIVTASDKGTLEEIKMMIEKFLEQRGLILSTEKTVIKHINDGFDFLGWNFRKFKGKLIIKPSHKSMGRITKKISGVIKDNPAAQETLIRRLIEVIVGWANYHHSTCAKRSFSTIDHRIWEMLWRWSKRRHPNKSKGWIVRRYWKPHKVSDVKLTETIKADYFATLPRIDRAVFYEKVHSNRG